jgi:hypothetical protein
MPADSNFVRRTRLLGLNVDNKRRRKEGATQNEFCLPTGEGARRVVPTTLIINLRQVPAQAFICSPVTYEMKFKPISFLPKDIFHCLPSVMF